MFNPFGKPYSEHFRGETRAMHVYRRLRSEGVCPEVAAAKAWPDDPRTAKEVVNLEKLHRLEPPKEEPKPRYWYDWKEERWILPVREHPHGRLRYFFSYGGSEITRINWFGDDDDAG